MSVKANIVYVKKLPEGSAVSYGGRFVADREMRVATVGIGYADGYPRCISGKAEMLVNGHRPARGLQGHAGNHNGEIRGRDHNRRRPGGDRRDHQLRDPLRLWHEAGQEVHTGGRVGKGMHPEAWMSEQAADDIMKKRLIGQKRAIELL